MAGGDTLQNTSKSNQIELGGLSCWFLVALPFTFLFQFPLGIMSFDNKISECNIKCYKKLSAQPNSEVMSTVFIKR